MLPRLSYIVAQSGADLHSPLSQPLPPPISKLHDFSFAIPNSASPLQTYIPTSSAPLYGRPPPTFAQTDPASFRPMGEWAYHTYEPSLSPESSSGPSYPDVLSSEEDEDRWQEYSDHMIYLENKHLDERKTVHRDKLKALRRDLQALSKGTNWVFQNEILADLESARQKQIADAESVTKCELSFLAAQYDQAITQVEDDYNNERESLKDSLLNAVEELRKQVREGNDDNDDGGCMPLTDAKVRVVFREAVIRPRHRRGIRRQKAKSTPYNINAQISATEGNELDMELKIMKKANSISARRS